MKELSGEERLPEEHQRILGRSGLLSVKVRGDDPIEYFYLTKVRSVF